VEEGAEDSACGSGIVGFGGEFECDFVDESAISQN
jgi:hypothetical protein